MKKIITTILFIAIIVSAFSNDWVYDKYLSEIHSFSNINYVATGYQPRNSIVKLIISSNQNLIIRNIPTSNYYSTKSVLLVVEYKKGDKYFREKFIGKAYRDDISFQNKDIINIFKKRNKVNMAIVIYNSYKSNINEFNANESIFAGLLENVNCNGFLKEYNKILLKIENINELKIIDQKLSFNNVNKNLIKDGFRLIMINEINNIKNDSTFAIDNSILPLNEFFFVGDPPNKENRILRCIIHTNSNPNFIISTQAVSIYNTCTKHVLVKLHK